MVSGACMEFAISRENSTHSPEEKQGRVGEEPCQN